MKKLLIIAVIFFTFKAGSYACGCVASTLCDDLDLITSDARDLIFRGSFIQRDSVDGILDAVQYKIETVYFGEVVTPASPFYNGEPRINTDSTIWVFSGGSGVCQPNLVGQDIIIAVSYNRGVILNLLPSQGYAPMTCSRNLFPISSDGTVTGFINHPFEEETLELEEFEEILRRRSCSSPPNLFEEFLFLSNIVDRNDCAGTTIDVYESGVFNFIHITNADGGELYFQDGTLFCTDAENFSCIDAYGLDTPIASIECEENGGGSTSQPDIATDFPWISDVIDFSNCNGTIVELYQFGSQVFPYIITDDSAVLYSNTGQLYCTSALPNFDCIDIYGLSAPIDTWRCDGGIGPDPLPGIFGDYPFLADILDPDGCDANVTVYQMGNFVALFIESNGETTMYNSDGLFYCQDAPNFSCLTTYGFTIDDIIDEWSCSGFEEEIFDTRSSEAQIDTPVLYPNPSNGIVYLKGLADSESYAYRLYDRQGASIMTGQISNDGHIDISELVSGIYILSINMGDEVTALKLIRM